MTFKELDRKADALATMYLRSGDGQTFDDLFKLMQPIVRKEAYKRSLNTRGLLHYDDLVSGFNEMIWVTAVHYKEKTRFTQRLRFNLNQKAIALYRESLQKKNIPPEMTMSLEFEDNVTGETLIDLIEDSEMTDDVVIIKKMLDEFCKTHEHYGKIVRMLEFGITMDELSKMLGAETYDDKTRQLITRIKRKLLGFLASEEQVA
ncbi:hypothetical protein H1S01_18805 [Heliobacterium chlorum]|uniref:Sigma-70 family RNA polymerase sigma factor n=1 Tax=Heliobacterium chlorum TaxID=2698 RepID=A0ABR7T6W4_HELCL|nr:hypothetical protein [Heliobacterium chlorum]MBC9786508.1 hypothetical protein [Heliobacterium chlorum]